MPRPSRAPARSQIPRTPERGVGGDSAVRGGGMGSFCRNVQDEGGTAVYPGQPVGVMMVVLGCIYFLTSIGTICFIKIQERHAKDGNDSAVQSVIFPIYVNILWISVIISILAGLQAWTLDYEPSGARDMNSAAFAALWGVQHIVNEGVAFLLMQKGLGVNATKHALLLATSWGVVTFFMQFGSYASEAELSFVFSLTWNIILWAFYSVLWLVPRKRLYRRPAALYYARFWTIFRTVGIASCILYYIDGTYPVGNCMFLFLGLLPYALFQPCLLYYTLLLDSRWWQGFELEGRRGGGEDIRSPLQGMDLNMRSAQSLAASMDNLGVREGIRNKKPVRLLNFAYISMDSSKMLGCGSFSKVYRGLYRQRPCAIKLIFTLDLTQSVIRRIASEALILSKIRHPNIVEIVGVSVLPPSVCILLELCEYGSLADVIGGTGPGPADDNLRNYLKSFMVGDALVRSRSPRKLAISWTDRLFMAIGCARGLSALHSYSAGLCHRDVKSFNFLVDSQLNAKLSDLELGATMVTPEDDSAMKRRKAILSNKRRKPTDSRSNSVRGSSQSTADLEAAVRSGGMGEEFTADDFLANWAAPEVIMDGLHSQPSDIYSFGLVLWEMLAGIVPFSDVKRQDDVRQKVLSGERPIIPAVFRQSPDFADFVHLAESCWAPEARQRPTALQVVAQLESIYKSRCYGILWATDALKDVDVLRPQPRGLARWVLPARDSSEPLGKDQLAQIWAQLKVGNGEDKESSVLDQFEDTGEAWVLLANDPSLTIVWASTAWEEQIAVDQHPLLGKSFKALSIFPSSGSSDTSGSDAFFAKVKQVEANQPKHAVLRLLCRPELTAIAPSRESMSIKPDQTSVASSALFALHAFPVVSKTPRVSSEIPIAEEEPETISTFSRMSNSIKSFSGASGVASSSKSFSMSMSQGPLELMPQRSSLFVTPAQSGSFVGQVPLVRDSSGSISMLASPVGPDAHAHAHELSDAQTISEGTERLSDRSGPRPSFMGVVNVASSDVVLLAVSFSKLN